MRCRRGHHSLQVLPSPGRLEPTSEESWAVSRPNSSICGHGKGMGPRGLSVSTPVLFLNGDASLSQRMEGGGPGGEPEDSPANSYTAKDHPGPASLAPIHQPAAEVEALLRSDVTSSRCSFPAEP